MSRLFAALVSVLLAGGGLAVPAAHAAGKPHVFANCDAMHRVYPHGVGRVGAHDKTSGTPVTNFHRSNSIYDANKNSDRDGDKIACEAH